MEKEFYKVQYASVEKGDIKDSFSRYFKSFANAKKMVKMEYDRLGVELEPMVESSHPYTYVYMKQDDDYGFSTFALFHDKVVKDKGPFSSSIVPLSISRSEFKDFLVEGICEDLFEGTEDLFQEKVAL